MSPRTILLGLILLGALSSLASACSQSTCTVDPRFPEEPVPAFECPSDSACYRGSCARTCTAGREGVEACASDGDCPGARPRCANARCTACDPGESCIPTLNICRPVVEIPLPPEPPRPDPDRPKPPRPLDGGVLDPGLTVRRDAGVVPEPIARPVTHAMLIDVFDETVRVGPGPSTSGVRIRSFAVSAPAGAIWRLDVDPPALEVRVADEGDCEVNRLVAPTSTPTPASFGPILIEDYEMSGALPSATALEASWSVSGYVLSPSPLPQPLLRLSDLGTLDSTFLTFLGSGLAGLTDGAWPDPEVGLHVPFELTPEPATAQLLSTPQSSSRDLEFRWARVGTGVVATERVNVRIVGRRAELVCRQLEGPGTPGAIRVSAGFLEQLRLAEAATPGTSLPLILERASAQQLQVDPDPATPDLRLFVTAQIRHGFRGLVRF